MDDWVIKIDRSDLEELAEYRCNVDIITGLTRSDLEDALDRASFFGLGTRILGKENPVSDLVQNSANEKGILAERINKENMQTLVVYMESENKKMYTTAKHVIVPYVWELSDKEITGIQSGMFQLKDVNDCLYYKISNDSNYYKTFKLANSASFLEDIDRLDETENYVDITLLWGKAKLKNVVSNNSAIKKCRIGIHCDALDTGAVFVNNCKKVDYLAITCNYGVEAKNRRLFSGCDDIDVLRLEGAIDMLKVEDLAHLKTISTERHCVIPKRFSGLLEFVYESGFSKKYRVVR